jgi:hypothetical protein
MKIIFSREAHSAVLREKKEGMFFLIIEIFFLINYQLFINI